MPGITSIMLPIMILSGWTPMPALTNSSTASAVTALQIAVCSRLYICKVVLMRIMANSTMPERDAAMPSARLPPKKMDSENEMTM